MPIGTGIGGCREPGECDEDRKKKRRIDGEAYEPREAYARIIYKKPLITVIHDLGAGA